MSSTSSTPKIALIGAGPASLTVANVLQRSAIPFAIYEAYSEIRTAGGSLDLHPRAGQLAIKEAGLWDEFTKYARPECDVLKLVDIGGEVLWDENKGAPNEEVPDENGNGEYEGRPEIDRTKLVELLAENVKHSIVFNKKLTKIVPTSADEKKFDIHFADGTQEKDFDLVVGGDGAWSKVREVLTPTKPHYSGISAIELWAKKPTLAAKPAIDEFVGAGSMFAFGEARAIQAQRQGDGSVKIYASVRAPEDFLQTCGIDWSNAETARKEYISKYFSHVGTDLQRLCTESVDNLTPRTLYHLPTDFRWPSRAGCTLIGDAAHVMTPFAGVGVNAAMLDALDLAKAIISAAEGQKSLEEATKAYEEEMWPRAQKYAEKTAKGLQGHFSEGGARKMAEFMQSVKGGPKPS